MYGCLQTADRLAGTNMTTPYTPPLTLIPPISLLCSRNKANQAAVALLPGGFRAMKQKFAAHGHDPDSVSGQTEGGVVKVYRPAVFEQLRHHCSIEEYDYLQSLDVSMLQCLTVNSKSGGAFWVSTDGKILVKTIKHYEAKLLRKLLDSYVLHVLTGPSAIGNILGLYRIRGRFSGTKYILVSKNVFPNPGVQCEKFDLKGSTVGRLSDSSSAVSKDLNVLQSNKKFVLGERARLAVLQLLARDTEFLARWRLMDYSLLVAVEQARHGDYGGRFSPVGPGGTLLSSASQDSGKVVLYNPGANLIFHMGVIDFLQAYTFRKFLETLFKSLYCDGKRISSVNPGFYAKRLVEFIQNITI